MDALEEARETLRDALRQASMFSPDRAAVRDCSRALETLSVKRLQGLYRRMTCPYAERVRACIADYFWEMREAGNA